MLKTAALVFGVVFLLVGILGFVPAAAPNGMLLGVFHVNAAHNVVHLLSGAVALWAGLTSVSASRLYFRVFGVVYALVAVLGFFAARDGMLLGLITNNPPDTWLHVAIAVAALVLGFVVKDEGAPLVRTP
jgi:hypothetical protein